MGHTLALLLAAGFALLPSSARAERHILYLQPLGAELPAADVQLVRRALVEFYALDVVALPPVGLPKAAWYAPRSRYRAERLLDFLTGGLPPDGIRILGLTGADISTTKEPYSDWGVLGLANMDGSACVISSFRAHRRARDRQQARIRLAKVAVHEIGHTLGLPHCPTVGCLMEDAQGQVVTTDRELGLCAHCRALLRQRGRVLPTPKIPWPAP